MKRRGRLLKTRPRRPGVYSNPPFIRGPAFIYQIHFLVLEVYLTKNQISTKTFKKCETMSSTLFHLSESGKLFIKKTSLTETVIELFSTLRFSVHEPRRKCIGNCSTANVLCKQF